MCTMHDNGFVRIRGQKKSTNFSQYHNSHLSTVYMCSSQYTVPVLAYLCASPATRQPRAPSWLQGPRLKARRLPPVAVAGDRSHSHSKVFISTPEETGPAHTQMKLQHRSRAPGPPYNSRTRSAAGPGRETLSPARSP